MDYILLDVEREWGMEPYSLRDRPAHVVTNLIAHWMLRHEGGGDGKG